MPSPAGRMGARAGSILRATMTMEVVPVGLMGALVGPPAELGRDCGGDRGRDGSDAVDTPPTARGDPITPARMRRECACSCSRMNPWKRFRRIHLPRLTAPTWDNTRHQPSIKNAIRKRKKEKTHLVRPLGLYQLAARVPVGVRARPHTAPHQKHDHRGARSTRP